MGCKSTNILYAFEFYLFNKNNSQNYSVSVTFSKTFATNMLTGRAEERLWGVHCLKAMSPRTV